MISQAISSLKNLLITLLPISDIAKFRSVKLGFHAFGLFIPFVARFGLLLASLVFPAPMSVFLLLFVALLSFLLLSLLFVSVLLFLVFHCSVCQSP